MAKKKLNAIQRGFVQKVVRTYRTASLDSVLLLAGILPLDLRIQEAAAIYEIKKGFSQRIVGDRVVETRVPYNNKVHPSEREETEYTCLEDCAELPNSIINIYTDGSKIEGTVGAALSIWDGAVETKTRKLKLDNCCTVYQVELLAINAATNIALATPGNYNILSDSRSALQTLADPDDTHPLAEEARKNIRRIKTRGNTINLYWVKAHVGITGNERADALAKDAALKLKKKPDYEQCPVSNRLCGISPSLQA
ncbi:ribonuclease H-like [Papilio machaon]|uniref:ribonuclease H-like n=1 Tax=Papilio machaon TaxID=76193 RepID=UPI001E66351F|nr:ribonuclease H-like [Papilio machaon]